MINSSKKGTLIQLDTCLYRCLEGSDTENLKINMKFSKDEIINISDNYWMILFNKNQKSIYILENNFDLSETSWGSEIYKSLDYISNVCWSKVDYTYDFFIFDEVGYVKKMNIKRKDDKCELVLTEDYFIEDHFISTEKHLIRKGILYSKFDRLWL